MTRLTPEALDALLAEHRGITRETGFGTSTDCADLQCPEWPCDIYLLATEVRVWRTPSNMVTSDTARTALETIHTKVGPAGDGLNEALDHYEEGTK